MGVISFPDVGAEEHLRRLCRDAEDDELLALQPSLEAVVGVLVSLLS